MPRAAFAALALAFFALSASGCAGPTAMETAPATGGAISPRLGETAALDDGPRFTFVEVVSDNRCPVDVQCVTAGEAVIRLAARHDGRRTEVTVRIPGLVPDDYSATEVFAAGATTLGAEIGLMALRPYPGTPEAERGDPVEAFLAVRPVSR